MLDQAKNVFIVGIKGVAMANLAIILKKMAKNVSGSDVKEEFMTDNLLEKNKITPSVNFNPNDLPKDTDLVIYSASHQGVNNPQVAEAKKRNIKVVHQAEILDQILSSFKTKIAVCGSHGKTTTSSLLSYALIKLKAKPSYLVGSPSFSNYYGGDYQKKDYFVIEADEYGVNPPSNKTPKFHYLNPDYILATNIDFDHPDVYDNLDKVKTAFFKFFDHKKLFICADDENLMSVVKKTKPFSYAAYGFSLSAGLQIINPLTTEENSSFELRFKGKNIGYFTISLFGKKNISNAAGVVLVLFDLGFPVEKIKKAMVDFSGAKRRFERVSYLNNTYLFDDYAHHPAEIKATILAAKERLKKRRIIVLFQPHTYSRTAALKKEFAESLSLAHDSLILPVFASAREKYENYTITAIDIEKAAQNQKKFNVKGFNSNIDVLKNLSSLIRPGDVVFTMGAGDVYKLKDDIIKIMKRKT